jgi:formate/nitrite transporter FocA (FNT family)
LSGGVGLLAYVAYPIGFMFVIFSRQQLFTTNAVPPVVVILDKDRSELPNMLRLWEIFFVTNILGTLAFAFVVTHTEIRPSSTLNLLLKEAAHKMENGFWALALKGVVGG